jgi:hypothetical protein
MKRFPRLSFFYPPRSVPLSRRDNARPTPSRTSEMAGILNQRAENEAAANAVLLAKDVIARLPIPSAPPIGYDQ